MPLAPSGGRRPVTGRRPPARGHAHQPAGDLGDDHDAVVGAGLLLPRGIRFGLCLGQGGTERIGRVGEGAQSQATEFGPFIGSEARISAQ
jgi:hypothetical protein